MPIDAEPPDCTGRAAQRQGTLQGQRGRQYRDRGRRPERAERKGCGRQKGTPPIEGDGNGSVAGGPNCLTTGEAALRDRIVSHVRRCGFTIGDDGSVRLPPSADMGDAYRRVQRIAKSEQVARRAGDMLRGQAHDEARRLCPDGSSIDPDKIDLEIRMLPKGGGAGKEAALFRWWNLAWWSMPWQPSYGRRLRYFLWDVHHDAPFGLVVMQSPLLRMAARDQHTGIDAGMADLHANMSMSAQRVGALPPYNMLIGGKMAALSLVCNEVRAEYAARYGGARTVMKDRTIDPHLLFVTTTAAFGKSSMYDRLTYRGRPAGTMVGWTRGNGTFHLPDDAVRGLYGVIERRRGGGCVSATYGNGPSAKMRMCREALAILGLKEMQVHGLRRAVYVFEGASNVRGVLRDGAEPAWHDRPLAGAAAWWMERWCRGRAARRDDWKRFKAGAFFEQVRKEAAQAAKTWPEIGSGSNSGGARP